MIWDDFYVLFKKHFVKAIFVWNKSTEKIYKMDRTMWPHFKKYSGSGPRYEKKKRLEVRKTKKRSLSEENSHSHTPQEPLHKSRQCEGQREEMWTFLRDCIRNGREGEVTLYFSHILFLLLLFYSLPLSCLPSLIIIPSCTLCSLLQKP